MPRSNIDANDATYFYDANGSTTKVITGASVSQTTKLNLWDLRNRLIAIDTNADDLTFNSDNSTNGSVNDTGDIKYEYDNNGIRVSKTVSGVKRTFINDELNPTGYAKPIEELVGGTANTSYILGLSVIGQSNATDGYLSLMQDGQGKTRGLMNLSGVDVQPEDYDVYGNALVAGLTKTSWENPDGYTDFETGTTYHLVRSFDRRTGTATSQDPEIFGIGEYHDANLHLYVGGSPLLFTDPSGKWELPQIMVAVGLTSIGLGIGVTIVGVKTNSPRMITTGKYMVTIGALLATAGTSALLAPEVPVGLKILASLGGTALIKKLWDITFQEAVTSANQAVHRIGVTRGLSDAFRTTDKKIPLVGRVVVRNGSEDWWNIARISLRDSKFISSKPPTQENDNIYTYYIMEDGTALVWVSRVENGIENWKDTITVESHLWEGLNTKKQIDKGPMPTAIVP